MAAVSPVTDRFELQERLPFEQNHESGSLAVPPHPRPISPESQPEFGFHDGSEQETSPLQQNTTQNSSRGSHDAFSSTSNPSSPQSLPPQERKTLVVGLPPWINDWWTLELASSVLSIGSTIAIVAILAQFDNKPLDSWRLSIQPNTVVSVLSTVAKSSLFLAVAECISQQKWLYYHSPRLRSFGKFDLFDQASRGPYGAIQLLFSIKSLPAILGALVTLLSLGMDPFTQQIISFQQESLNLGSNRAQVALSRNYDTGRGGGGGVQSPTSFPLTDNAPEDLQSAFYSGLFGSPLNPIYKCDAATCTWQEYSSLGVCSQCIDVSKTAKKNCTNLLITGSGSVCNFTTPANFSLSVSHQATPHDSRAVLFGSSSLAVMPIGEETNQLLSLGTLKVPTDYDGTNLADQGLQVYDCSLRFCGKTYASLTFTNGTYTEAAPIEWDFASIGPEWTTSSNQPYRTFTPPVNLFNSTGNYTGNWTVNLLDWDAISTYISQLLTTPSNTNTNDASFDKSINQAVWNLMYSSPDLPKTISNIATSMTNAIRNSEQGTTFAGTAFRDQIKIHVSWPWIILPVTVILGGNLLLLVTIVQSRRTRMPLWRSSSLAILYHGFESFDRSEPLATMSQMEEAAELRRVRLAGTEARDMRFVGI